MILFWDEADTIRVVLTERSARLKNHQGEISFPGGRMEQGENLMQTALREADEEIGISRQKVSIIGRLDDAWSAAAYHLAAFVGWYDDIPDFTVNSKEVKKILVPAIDDLFDKSNHKEKTVAKHGIVFSDTLIKYRDSVIFGLTADLLLEALEQGLGINTARGNKREKMLREALHNNFFTAGSG